MLSTAKLWFETPTGPQIIDVGQKFSYTGLEKDVSLFKENPEEFKISQNGKSSFSYAPERLVLLRTKRWIVFESPEEEVLFEVFQRRVEALEATQPKDAANPLWSIRLAPKEDRFWLCWGEALKSTSQAHAIFKSDILNEEEQKRLQNLMGIYQVPV